ncbi:MAG TPA: polysaccharide lyase family protein [Verrucomicrobiae bacterium]
MTRWLCCLLVVATFGWMCPAYANGQASVTVTQDATTYTLANGILAAQISKKSGDLISLQYQGQQMLDVESGRQEGYWSHNTARAERVVPRISIDPNRNGGERAEVSVKGFSDGNQLGSGPGGSIAADIEIRYTLEHGASGLYTYATFSHPKNYPATSFGEARFCLKLNDDIFDWMTVDQDRNLQMLTTYDWNHGTQLNMKEVRRLNSGIYQGQVEHKYDYSANQFDVRAWGWSSTTKKVGLWLINPSVEYLSGGPTKYELSSHRDATFNTNRLDAPAPPTLLNYWRSSHYGGSICNVGTNENWSKVVGPFQIYCNQASNHAALWPAARAQAEREAQAWPYAWVQGVDYPHHRERSTVTGRIILNDPLAPTPMLKFTNLLVGLTAPDYIPAFVPRPPRPGGGNGMGGSRNRGEAGGFGLAGGGDDEAYLTNNPSSLPTNRPPQTEPALHRPENPANGTNTNHNWGTPPAVNWQIDARNYEFWVHADANGHFEIPNVRPGKYTLHAIADGVLGELVKSNITVRAGEPLSLGEPVWEPTRYGRQLWDIGIPNRKASEFFKGDQYFHWGWYVQYPKLFPLDVNYEIGKSDYRRDWFLEEVPYNQNTNNNNGTGWGDGTTWAVIFKLTNAPQGTATLRLALAGAGTRTLGLSMNTNALPSITNLIQNSVIHRDGITGTWCERDVTFNAALLHPGTNTLELTVYPGTLTAGVMYDYLRLELDATKAWKK